jgi:hypothetical protein
LTIIAWVKAYDTNVPDWTPVVQKYGSYGIKRASSQTNIEGFVHNAGIAIPVCNVFDNEWHMVAMTLDGSTLKAYVDDVVIAENVGAGAPGVNTNAIRIGAAGYAGGIEGLIDDIKIYDTALTDEEVLAHIPEPTTILLLGLGYGAMLIKRKKN